MKKLLVLIFALILAACGIKGDPQPKYAMEMPDPAFNLEISEAGVVIENTGEHIILVDRAISEIGDLTRPQFTSIASIEPGESFIDDTIVMGERYIYRFRNFDNVYRVYSSYVTRVVSYRGIVKIEELSWNIDGEEICINARLSSGTARAEVFINGASVGALEDGMCYVLPAVSTILLLVVPYSDSDTPGLTYSDTIQRDLSSVLLPPQNIRLIRQRDSVTLSWDEAPGSPTYRVYTPDGRYVQTTATIITVPVAEDACSHLRLSALRGGQESRAVELETCP